MVDFDFNDEEEKQLLSSAVSSHGGNLAVVASKRDIFTGDLLQRLEPYRCAMVLHNPQPKLRYHRALDNSIIMQHVYPEIGMYTIINGNVYEMDAGRFINSFLVLQSNCQGVQHTGFLYAAFAHLHPGGRQVIERLAGRDATQDFVENHENWEELLKGMTEIGHLVPYRKRGRLATDELEYHGKIYKLNLESFVSGMVEHTIEHEFNDRDELLSNEDGLRQARERFQQQYMDLEPHLGKDVSSLGHSPETAHIVYPLGYLEHLVVGHTYNPKKPTREITSSELAQNRRLIAVDELDPDAYLRASFNQATYEE